MSTPPERRKSKTVLDVSLGGRKLTPEAKAFIMKLAARAAYLDGRRRAMLGQTGASPIATALAGAGLVPDTSVPSTPRTATRHARPSAAGPRPAPQPARTSAFRATISDFVDTKAKAVSDNLDYYGDRARQSIEDGRRWLDRAPQVVQDNLDYYLPGLDDYLEMVSEAETRDAGWLTPEQAMLPRPERKQPDYNAPHFQDIRRRRESLHPVARQVDAAGRSFADTTTAGGANYVAAFMETVNPFDPYSYSYTENLEGQRYIDLLDSQDARAGQITGRVVGSFAQPGSRFVAAGQTLPASMMRAVVVDGANGFAHGVIETPGNPWGRLEQGAQEALSDALFAPLGPLSDRGVAEVAPLTARQYPFLKTALSGLASTAPKELADAMADAEKSRRARSQ